MGLDMYLYRLQNEVIDEEGSVDKAFGRQYDLKANEYGVNDHKADDWTRRYQAFMNDKSFNVLYWRKANAIHDFFVQHAQEGEDDCGYYTVDISVIDKLLSDIDTRIKQALTGERPEWDVLPTARGFFFGGTDYDEYYFQELERTRDVLQEVMDGFDSDNETFVYHSSW